MKIFENPFFIIGYIVIILLLIFEWVFPSKRGIFFLVSFFILVLISTFALLNGISYEEVLLISLSSLLIGLLSFLRKKGATQ